MFEIKINYLAARIKSPQKYLTTNVQRNFIVVLHRIINNFLSTFLICAFAFLSPKNRILYTKPANFWIMAICFVQDFHKEK